MLSTFIENESTRIYILLKGRNFRSGNAAWIIEDPVKLSWLSEKLTSKHPHILNRPGTELTVDFSSLTRKQTGIAEHDN